MRTITARVREPTQSAYHDRKGDRSKAIGGQGGQYKNNGVRHASILGPRMVLGMDGLQPIVGDMGVDLCRGDVCVTKQHLHSAQISAVI